MSTASDPCYPAAADLLSVEEAIAALLSEAAPLAETESLALADAANRVLAAAITSPIDVQGIAVHRAVVKARHIDR